MSNHPFFCDDENRRQIVRASVLNGIDYIEVVDHDAPDDSLRQRTLLVFCLKPVAGNDRSNVLITGGARVRTVGVLWAHPASAIPDGLLHPAEDPAYYTGLPNAANVLVVRTDAPGDFSRYRLSLVNAGTTQQRTGFDRLLSYEEFSFKVECPSDFDCVQDDICPPETYETPEIDYLTKDYASFRRLMLDRMSVLMPNWRERNPADMQIAMTELLAYVGDRLSYYQDAVATEGYLGTARRRISVRRHTRMLDYRMHEGANARAWVVFEVDRAVDLPAKTVLLSRVAGGTVLAPASTEFGAAKREAPTVFETMYATRLRTTRNRMLFYTWGDAECTLPAGSTQATLRRPASLPQRGDVLIFEEEITPERGPNADPDPRKRHAVRLTEVVPETDQANGNIAVVRIRWHDEDALPFALCVSAIVRDADGDEALTVVSVARGNVVLADEGETRVAEPLVPPKVPSQGRYRPHIGQPPLVFAGLRVDPDVFASASAASALAHRPETALPSIVLNDRGDEWEPRYDLLNADRFDRYFAVEPDSDGLVYLRFGDGVFGAAPLAGSELTATYRIGGGARGNVGAEVITRVVTALPGITRVRNPMPAHGGVDPEPVERARLHAPHAFHTPERAVTEDDYARMTERYITVQRAAAAFRWTGSWYTTFVTVDRLGGLPIDTEFEPALRRHLDRYRMTGTDLEIDAPVPVALDIALSVCVKPGHFRSDVEQALLRRLGSSILPDGSFGFLHPDRFTFGQPLYLSALYEAALSVEGVDSVVVTRFQRWGRSEAGELADGAILAGAKEILQLANDPNFPENGRITFEMEGGL